MGGKFIYARRQEGLKVLLFSSLIFFFLFFFFFWFAAMIMAILDTCMKSWTLNSCEALGLADVSYQRQANNRNRCETVSPCVSTSYVTVQSQPNCCVSTARVIGAWTGTSFRLQGFVVCLLLALSPFHLLCPWTAGSSAEAHLNTGVIQHSGHRGHQKSANEKYTLMFWLHSKQGT